MRNKHRILGTTRVTQEPAVFDNDKNRHDYRF